ncbi:hypothetical protein X566_03855 [Afipia sp. P52-10]|nr:hypothetical protein X566_03855 [Afipia sp. P52-10]
MTDGCGLVSRQVGRRGGEWRGHRHGADETRVRQAMMVVIVIVVCVAVIG